MKTLIVQFYTPEEKIPDPDREIIFIDDGYWDVGEVVERGMMWNQDTYDYYYSRDLVIDTYQGLDVDFKDIDYWCYLSEFSPLYPK